MTLPTPDAQSASFLPTQAQTVYSTYSMPVLTPTPSSPISLPITPIPASHYDRETSQVIASSTAVSFTMPSWDQATGGLKTLTAKRELPPRLDWRTSGYSPDATRPARRNVFLLIILLCILVMLLSGGMVLYMILQA